MPVGSLESSEYPSLRTRALGVVLAVGSVRPIASASPGGLLERTDLGFYPNVLSLTCIL